MPHAVPSQAARLIRSLFPWTVLKNEAGQGPVKYEDAPALAAALGVVRSIPGSLITLDSREYAAYEAGLALLEYILETWKTRGNVKPAQYLKGYSRHPLAIILRLLLKCPDEAPSPAARALTFLKDSPFRDALREDMGRLGQAYFSGQYKAAAILGGSVAETLLVHALKTLQSEKQLNKAKKALRATGKIQERVPADPAKWGPGLLGPMALELGLIEEDTALLLRLAGDFRLFIHPEKALRLKNPCGREEAMGIMLALEALVREMEALFQQEPA